MIFGEPGLAMSPGRARDRGRRRRGGRGAIGVRLGRDSGTGCVRAAIYFLVVWLVARHRADARRRLRVAAAHVPGVGRLGDRARNRVRRALGGAPGRVMARVAATAAAAVLIGVQRSASSTRCGCGARGRRSRGARSPTSSARRSAAPPGHADHRRRAAPELGLRAAARAAAAVHGRTISRGG